tara:strand:- start:358 stop:699 length:342 start_codon:yes stop_codon:yes gene_type:complete
MSDNQNKGLHIPEIDLGAARRGELNESSYTTSMGAALKWVLQGVFAGMGGKMKLKGSQAEIDSFLNALSKEKSYLEKYMGLGLNNPATMMDAQKLRGAISQFESTTGLTWPFK